MPRRFDSEHDIDTERASLRRGARITEGADITELFEQVRATKRRKELETVMREGTLANLMAIGAGLLPPKEGDTIDVPTN